MAGMAEVPMELACEPEAATLPDEFAALNEDVTNLIAHLERLENKLSFVLSSQFAEEKQQPIPELGPGRSESSSAIREMRIRVIYSAHGISNLIQRLDL